MLTIYGVYRSRAARNFWLLHELDLAHEHVPVIQAYRLADPEAEDAPFNTLSPGFLSISPAGAVPVLRDGSFTLSESLSINHYIARKTGGPLAPADLQEGALMEQWASYGLTALEPHTLAILQAPENKATAAARVEAAHTALRRPLAVLERHLEGAGHLVGDRFTVADLNMAEIVRYMQSDSGFLARYPAVCRWLAACQDRPAFHQMMRRRTAEPA